MPNNYLKKINCGNIILFIKKKYIKHYEKSIICFIKLNSRDYR